MLVAVFGQQRLDALLHLAAGIVIRQRRRIAVEQGIRLQRQVVAGQMLRLVFQRDAHILLGLCQRLLRQGVHQVEVDIVEMALRDIDRTACFIRIVDAPQRLADVSR